MFLNRFEQQVETNHEQELNDFEHLYIDVRKKEKRVLTDSQVMFLPDIDSSHIHYPEWQIRKRSSQKLIAYLKKKNKPLHILEIGCGNGWLCSNLSTLPNSQITGLDINRLEINQAKRVFKKDNLGFIYGVFAPETFPLAKFDVILFAASIQYFPSVKNILQNALTFLSPDGEIHIMDSHFYKPAEMAAAAQRTLDYYKALDHPEMADHYFHHTLNNLQQFNYKVLASPPGIFNRFFKKTPFYWLSIKHSH